MKTLRITLWTTYTLAMVMALVTGIVLHRPIFTSLGTGLLSGIVAITIASWVIRHDNITHKAHPKFEKIASIVLIILLLGFLAYMIYLLSI
jgi:hypothetical protein